jgi:RNA polymerase sigma-70 factor (ECF subfamily)
MPGAETDDETRVLLERKVLEFVQAGDLKNATTAALKGYGPEVYGFLCALERNDDDAAEAFAQFGEDVWRGIAGFDWECSLRTWLYTLARNASHRLHRGPQRANVPLSQAPDIAALTRTQTQSFLRTETKDAFARLRTMLPPDDEALLVLRVDRQLDWNELARVLSGVTNEADLKREAARLRKRFQLVKERLIELGLKEGLLQTQGREP